MPPSVLAVFACAPYLLLVILLPPSSRPTPHPLPEGHVYRDLQITVSAEKIEVDVNLKASDLTWVELLNEMDRQWLEVQAGTNQDASKPATQPDDSADTNQGDRQGEGSEEKDSQRTSKTREALKTLHDRVQREAYLPLPTNEDKVATWLTKEDNRKIIAWWVAANCDVQLGQTFQSLQPIVDSRQNSRHHWAINVQLSFNTAGADDLTQLTMSLNALNDYPGLVRRAIKTRGDVFLENSQLAVAVVRADFEERSPEAIKQKTPDTISASVRF